MSAVKWLVLVSFWIGVFIIIKPGFESPTCGSNVNLGVAIFMCDFGFINYVFGEVLISNRAIGFFFFYNYNVISF